MNGFAIWLLVVFLIVPFGIGVGGYYFTERRRNRRRPEWLIPSARALLDLDTKGALKPHGIGVHSRRIIEEFLRLHESA